MSRLLLALPFFAAYLAAADLADMLPYLDINSTAHFKSLVAGTEEANAKRSDNNKTVLMYAVWVGNAEAVKHLLSKGADINAKDSEGITPLLLAIYTDRNEIAAILIAQGADVNASAHDGTTPLMMSRIRQNKEIEEALLNASLKNKESE